MPRHIARPRVFLLALAAAGWCSAIFASPTFAGTYTWTGGGADSVMQTIGNWSLSGGDAGQAGIGGDAVVFTGSVKLTPSWNPSFTASNQAVQSLTFNSGASAFTVSGQVLVSLGVTNNSSLAQSFTNNVTFRNSGSPTVDAASGDLSFAGIGYNSTSDPVTFTGAHNITISSGFTFNATANGKIFNKNGSGTLSVNGSSSGTVDPSTVTLNINAGAVVVGNNATLNTIGNVNLGATSGTAAAALYAGSGRTISRDILVRSGSSGTSTLGSTTDSTTTFTGLITAQKSFTVSQSATTGANDLNLTGGVTSGAGGTQTVTFTGAGAIQVSSSISNGTGTLAVLKSGVGTLTLSSANSFTGAVTINDGVLSVSDVDLNGSSSHLGAGSSLVFGGGTLAFTAAGADATNRAVTINAGGATLQVSSASGHLTLTGAISSSGGLTKTGAGILELTSNNSYSGGTLISAGTLEVSNGAGSAAGTGGVTIGSAGNLAGIGTISGLVATAAKTSQISPGSSPGTLSLTGGLNAAAGATFNFEVGAVSDLLDLGGGVFTGSTAANGLLFNFINTGSAQAGVAYTLIEFGAASGLHYTDLQFGWAPAGMTLDPSFGVGGWQINANSLQVQFMLVPEPSSLVLLGILTPLGLWYGRRRFRSRRASH